MFVGVVMSVMFTEIWSSSVGHVTSVMLNRLFLLPIKNTLHYMQKTKIYINSSLKLLLFSIKLVTFLNSCHKSRAALYPSEIVLLVLVFGNVIKLKELGHPTNICPDCSSTCVC